MSQTVASSEAGTGPGYAQKLMAFSLDGSLDGILVIIASVEKGTWASFWHRITVIWK